MDVRSAMKVPKYRWILWAATAAAAVFFVTRMGFLSRGHAGTAARGFELLDTLISHIRNDYLEERDPLATAEGTYRGLVNSLDPLSAYLPKDLVAAYTARTGREAEPGIVVLKRYASFPQVVAVVEKSPAEAAGIKPGDVLSAIDGRSTLSMSLTEVKLRLRGTDGQPVDLRVLEGNDTNNLDGAARGCSSRRRSRSPGRPASPPGCASIASTRTSSPGSSATSCRRSRAARTPRPRPARLPGRRGRGGRQARQPVRPGRRRGLVRGPRRRQGDRSRAPPAAELGTAPVVVWTDAGTAGPAELAAGLLQELRKVKIVGYKTAGLVARTALFPLKDDSAVAADVGHLRAAFGPQALG